MSRFTVWLMCCVVVLLAGAGTGKPFELRIAMAMITYLAIPLFIHWMFDRKPEPRHD